MQSGKNSNLVGVTLDQRYLVQELIGTGTHGAVYKADDLTRKYSVALKVLSESVADEKSRERYRHGVETAVTLAHPNIVRLYSFNVTQDGKPYYVMDYVQGGQNLSNLLQEKGQLSEQLCISIFAQVCDALEHAHAKGVVHRNLKPSNIMLIAAPGDSFMVKIADFGVSKSRGEKETRQSLAKKGEMLGNPLYMSPEQCTGGKIDERADMYAVGCLLYECLTGKPPFAGANSFEIMQKHVNEMPVDVATVAPTLKFGKQLSCILNRAMSKKPGDRYQSAGEMSHDMNLILEAPQAEWEEKAVCMRPPVPISRPEPESSSAIVPFEVMKPVLIGCAVVLLIGILVGFSMVGIALVDADIKPLLRYKIAVQEIIFAPNDERLIRNLNTMTDIYKAEGKYADAWQYKEKALRAAQPAAASEEKAQ